MVGLGLALSLLFVPTISQPGRALSKPSLRVWAREQVDMMQMFVKLLYPNVFLSVSHPGRLVGRQAADHLLSGLDLRLPGLVSVLFACSSPRFDQSALPSDISSCLRPFLPRARSGILPRLGMRRQVLRHDNDEEDTYERRREISTRQTV